jgi:hypothetical protein
MTLRTVAADRSRPEYFDKRARPDRLSVRDVAFDQRFEEPSGAFV